MLDVRSDDGGHLRCCVLDGGDVFRRCKELFEFWNGVLAADAFCGSFGAAGRRGRAEEGVDVEARERLVGGPDAFAASGTGWDWILNHLAVTGNDMRTFASSYSAICASFWGWVKRIQLYATEISTFLYISRYN